MCGIVGHLAFNSGSDIQPDFFSRLNDLMTHRGPNSGGVFSDGPVKLGMRRLSIIDVEGGYQPMTCPYGRFTIVFNGEIYNFKEIRHELEVRGHRFRTSSDTEVLLNAFREFGPDCLSRLNGMFAFAIWDATERSLFIARDRLGVKPLYVAHDHRCLLFSSELDPIHKSGLFNLEISIASISDLMAHWYICDPATIYGNVVQLLPGHCMIVRGRDIRTWCWWRVPTIQETDISEDEALSHFDDLFREAVKIRLRSDVPVAAFLSGGIDSGLVTHEACQQMGKPITCFTFRFDEESYSELEYTRLTATHLGADLREVDLPSIDADRIHDIFLSLDEPYGNASAIPTYLLFEAVHKDFPVILTGDGSDELFGGYPTYQTPGYQRIHNMFPRWFWSMIGQGVGMMPVSHRRISFDYKLRQFLRGAALSPDRAHAAWRELLNWDERESLFREEFHDSLLSHDSFRIFADQFAMSSAMEHENQCMHADIATYLRSDHLRKIDRLSMRHSVEARQPFLDYRIVEFAMSLPTRLKVSMFETKRLLRRKARRDLPRRVAIGGKKGLTSPIPGWISGPLRGYVAQQLQGRFLNRYFRPDALHSLLNDHLNGNRDHSRAIWALLSLQVWGEKNGYE